LGVNINMIECKRTCLIKEEIGSYAKEEECCLEYRKVQLNPTDFACIICGDGICSENEDIYSCYEDCGSSCITDKDCGCWSAPIYGSCVNGRCICYTDFKDINSSITEWQKEEKDILDLMKAFRLWIYFNLN